MKKVFCILLALLMLPAAALADPDLAAMSTDDLEQLRFDIDRVLASRVGGDTEQVLEMEGVFFSLDYAAIGTANAFENSQFIQKTAIVIFIRASNTTEEDFLVRSSFDAQATLDGVLLEPLKTASDTVLLPDGSTFKPNLSASARIRPGAVKLQLGFGFFIPEDAAGTVSVDFTRNWISNGYGGFFDIALSDLAI